MPRNQLVRGSPGQIVRRTTQVAAAAVVAQMARSATRHVAQRLGDNATQTLWRAFQRYVRRASQRAGSVQRADPVQRAGPPPPTPSRPNRFTVKKPKTSLVAPKKKEQKEDTVMEDVERMKGSGRLRSFKKMTKHGRRKSVRKGKSRRRTVRTRRSRASPASAHLKKAQQFGHVFTTEDNGTVVDAQCVYLGHATMAQNPVMKTLGAAIVHKYYNSRGVVIHNWYDVVNDTVLLNYTINYGYKYSVTLTTISGNWSPTDTFKTAATNLTTTLLSIPNGNDNLIIYDINFAAASGSSALDNRKFDFETSKFHISVVSKITIQNQTLGAAVSGDNLITAVDATELVGLHYSGTGNGTLYADLPRTTTGNLFTPFIGTGVDGTIRKNGAQDSTFALTRPPPKSSFDHVRKAVKFSVKSGAEWKRTLRSNVTGTLSQIFRKMEIIDSTSLITIPSTQLGSFEFYGLERTIKQGGNNIVLAFETNYTISSYMLTTPPISMVEIAQVNV